MLGICKFCGCTDNNACVTEEGPCYWVKDDVCSACVEVAIVEVRDQEK
jgi:hypothetical protein